MGERDRCPGERTQRSAAADHTVAETPSLVNFSAWLMHRLGGGGSSYSTFVKSRDCFSKKISFFTLQIHVLQNGNKSASSQQSVLTIRSLPGLPGRKVLTLCALAIWDVSGFVSCLAGVNLQDAAIRLSFDPCSECVICFCGEGKKN